MKNLSIRQRVIASFALILALMLLMAVLSELRLNQIREEAQTMARSTLPGLERSYELLLIADKLLDSIGLLANAARLLADKAIAGFRVRGDRIGEALARNPVLITAANRVLGYEQGAAIAKQAYRENRPVLDVAAEVSGLPRADLRRLLDPDRLTRGGILESPARRPRTTGRRSRG